MERRLKNEWEVSAYDHKKGEWTTATNRSYEHTEPPIEVNPVERAQLPQMRPRQRKIAHKTLLVFGDAQIGYRRIDDTLVPLHDEAAINSALKLANDLRPDVVVDLGDTTDFSELSRYPADSDHFQGTLQPSLQRTHDFFAQFSSVTPNAERVTVDSNHVKRLTDYVLKNALPLYNVKATGEKYPAISYPGLLRLDDIGWDYIQGYGAAEYEYADDLAFIHGTFSVSNGSTANKLGKANPDRNIVQGHVHRMETAYHTDRKGRVFGAFAVGSLCRNDGIVPSYHNSIAYNQPVIRHENWQQGLMVINDYGEGHYQFDQVPIKNGVIHYNGKEYSGHEV